MNRIKLLGLVPALVLTACKPASPYGTYSFRLGKTDGSHVGISATLLNEDYEKIEGMKKMTLTAEVGEDFSIAKIAESYAEEYPIVAFLLEDLIKKLDDVSSIDGYYKITDIKNAKYGKRLAIGTDYISEFLKQAYPEIFDNPDLDIDITPEMFQMFVCAYLNDKALTFQLPVSLEDIKEQFVWYGYYFDMEATPIFQKLDMDKIPGPKDDTRYGTHPTVVKDKHGKVVEDQIAIVNEAFEFNFSHTVLYSEEHNALGRFVVHTNENNQRTLFYQPIDPESSKDNISGYVRVKDIFGEYTETKNMKFSINSSFETNVTYNHKEAKEEGFTDENGTEFTFDSFMEKPFMFRDFHDVKVGLTKV